MERIPHDQLVIGGVLKALSKEAEPLTAATYFDPNEPLIPYSKVRRGRFNVEGKLLHILGIPIDQIATLTPTQVRETLADGILGSSALQRGFLPYFDSRRFGLSHRTSREIARILNNPNIAFAERGGEVANLAEVVSGYSDETCSHIEPIPGPEGMLYATNNVASKLLMAANIRYQRGTAYQKDIRNMANFTAQAVMRNITQDLPPHIQDIACWAANEVQMAGEEGQIVDQVHDPILGTLVVKSELFFLSLLVDPEGQPLTIEYLRDYTLKGWEKPTSREAMARDTKRVMGTIRLAEKRLQLQAKKDPIKGILSDSHH